jgi:hypothetical protein
MRGDLPTLSHKSLWDGKSAGARVTLHFVVLGGVMVIVFVIGPKVRGFTSHRRRWIFKGDKNP